MARRRSPFIRSQPMVPRGEPEAVAGLGEWGGDPRRYSNEPTIAQVLGADKQPFQGTARPLKEPRVTPLPAQPRVLPDPRGANQVYTIPAVTSSARVWLPVVGNLLPVRLDIGMEARITILIQNMSVNLLWVNFTEQTTQANVGIPLGPATAAGMWNGASLSWDVDKNVEFWGICAAGAANRVLVIEGSRYGA